MADDTAVKPVVKVVSAQKAAPAPNATATVPAQVEAAIDQANPPALDNSDNTGQYVNGHLVVYFTQEDKISIKNNTVGPRGFMILKQGLVYQYSLLPGQTYVGYLAEPNNPLFYMWQSLGAVTIRKVL